MDIVQERLEREYGLGLIATAPSVSYDVLLKDGEVITIDNPSKLPDNNQLAEIYEPWVNITVVSPSRYIGPIMELVTTKRGEYKKMEYIQTGAGSVGGTARVIIEYEMPLAEMLADFFDQLKSRTQGYASLDYELIGTRESDLVRLDILVNEQPVDALGTICHRSEGYKRGKALVSKLRQTIPRQLFDVPIQAAIGGRIISRETVRALRKNVLAKCYGGDITRKRKLLEKQAEGKRRMRRIGNVEVPQEAFLAMLKLEDN